MLLPVKGASNQGNNADDLFATLKGLYAALKQVEASAGGLLTSVQNAFQPTGEGYKGCIFSSSPTCGELVYPDGFNTVYEYSPPGGFGDTFTGLPVPILFIVYNKTSGIISIDTPVFFPTKKK